VTGPSAPSTSASPASPPPPRDGGFGRFLLALVGLGICGVNLWLLWHEEHAGAASTTHLMLFLGGLAFGVLVILATIPGAVAAVTASVRSIGGSVLQVIPARFRGGDGAASSGGAS
jgi:hypothetical protein